MPRYRAYPKEEPPEAGIGPTPGGYSRIAQSRHNGQRFPNFRRSVSESGAEGSAVNVTMGIRRVEAVQDVVQLLQGVVVQGQGAAPGPEGDLHFEA